MWDERYSTDDYVYGQEPNDFLRENGGQLKPGSALCLTEGGVFLLEAYTEKQLSMPGIGGPPVPELMFSAEMLKQDFQSLEVVQSQETVREVNEGTKHYGHSAVVQFIARQV